MLVVIVVDVQLQYFVMCTVCVGWWLFYWMCSYSIFCCVPLVCDFVGYFSGCAVTVFCAVYRLCAILMVISVNVQLQYFVLCNVCVRFGWLFKWMCSYSILCCVTFVCDFDGYFSGCAVTVFCAVYRLCAILMVILVDVHLQYFVLCTVCVGCWWLFYWMCSYSILCCVPLVCDFVGCFSGCTVTIFCAVYRLCAILMVILVDVQLQYFVLCTVFVRF
jgi:hypothetical protein